MFFRDYLQDVFIKTVGYVSCYQLLHWDVSQYVVVIFADAFNYTSGYSSPPDVTCFTVKFFLTGTDEEIN